MKDIGEGTIRRIDWTELTPVVLLLRILNISLGIRILLIALVGLLLMFIGVSFLDPRLAELVPQYNRGELQFRFNFPAEVFSNIFSVAQDPASWKNPKWLMWLPGVILIGTLCGGMISRIVAVRMTIDESESMGNLLLFLRKRGICFFSAIFLSLLGVVCCFLPVKIAGWLLAVPLLNYVVAIFFPIPFVFTVLTMILAVVLAVGWMLLFAAVSVDGSDGFDAISRMFSYVCQRPLHYVLYWICCGILGWLGFQIIYFFTFFSINLCWTTVPADSGFFVTFWVGLFALIPRAYVLAWFWTSSVAIYLLLRRSVDATPFNEVYRLSPPKVRSLPTIQSDERGAPEIAPPTEPNPEPAT